jgi:hypothetical protein
MKKFTAGDRVVATNTDLSAPLCGPMNSNGHQFIFPDGELQEGIVYHVASVSRSRDGHQGLKLTGLRIHWAGREIPWNSSRFRMIKSSESCVRRIAKNHSEP